MKKFLVFILVGACTLSYQYFNQTKSGVKQQEIITVMNNIEIEELRYSIAQIKDTVQKTVDHSESYLLNEEKIQSYRSVLN